MSGKPHLMVLVFHLWRTSKLRGASLKRGFLDCIDALYSCIGLASDFEGSNSLFGGQYIFARWVSIYAVMAGLQHTSFELNTNS